MQGKAEILKETPILIFMYMTTYAKDQNCKLVGSHKAKAIYGESV
jgi:hypothetical protein